MEYEEASEQQQGIVAALVAYILRFFATFQAAEIPQETWIDLLGFVYPQVERARRESAVLGRAFYDSQRELHIGTRRDIWLASYSFEEFVNRMEPARAQYSEPFASEQSLAQVAMRAAKEVEDGWRRTMIRAVQEDEAIAELAADLDDARYRVGWARVATGRETCGFCMMLVSRGPVYLSAQSAGLNASDTKADQLLERSDTASLDALMTRWHPGCDCRVVPVYDAEDWVGRAAYQRAEALWRKVTKGYSGRDALNAFRRAVESGEIPIEEFATAA